MATGKSFGAQNSIWNTSRSILPRDLVSLHHWLGVFYSSDFSSSCEDSGKANRFQKRKKENEGQGERERYTPHLADQGQRAKVARQFYSKGKY